MAVSYYLFIKEHLAVGFIHRTVAQQKLLKCTNWEKACKALQRLCSLPPPRGTYCTCLDQVWHSEV